MHELSLCRGLLTQLEALAAREGGAAIRRVVLRIGPLAGVEPQLMRSAFPLASADSSAAGAVLEIEEAPLRIRCHRCGGESAALPNQLTCSHCSSSDTQLISGDELLLVKVEFAPVTLNLES